VGNAAPLLAPVLVLLKPIGLAVQNVEGQLDTYTAVIAVIVVIGHL
jgi:hypothetical protein